MIETKKRNWWVIGVVIFFAVAIIWCLTGVLSYLLGFQSAVAYASIPFTDNFESYQTGLLNGQGGWDYFGAGDSTMSVVDSGCHSGTKCAYKTGVDRIDKLGEYVVSGSWTFWIKNSNPNTFEILLHGSWENWDIACGEIWTNRNDTDMSIYDMAGGFPIVKFDTAIDNEWFLLTIEWDFGTMKYRAKINDHEFSGWYNIYNQCNGSGFRGVRFRNSIGPVFVDDISETSTEPRVWGIDPVSGTGITNLGDTFEFGWENLEDWDTLTAVFKNRDTGILMEAQELLITTSPSGSMVFNFSDFNPDRNGIFYFFAVAGRSVMETIQGMFITGRWTYEWSYDLVDPEYWLNFNIEGLTPVFEMSDFEGWYGDISKFATPTDMAVAITGFFEPIFQKLGEFGNRISDYFNVNEAYAQGYEIGKNIPYFTYFLDQLNMFFGGFPVMKWLFVLILLLVGIFIFRLIMKFIPFLGN